MRNPFKFLFSIPSKTDDAYRIVPWMVSWVGIFLLIFTTVLLSPGSFEFEYRCIEKNIVILEIRKTLHDSKQLIILFSQKDSSKVFLGETFDGDNFEENNSYLVSICEKYRIRSFWRKTETKLNNIIIYKNHTINE